MYKQVTKLVLICIALGVAVGLAVNLSSGGFRAQVTNNISLNPAESDPNDPEARAADIALPLFPQFIADEFAQETVPNKSVSSVWQSIKHSVAPSALAQTDGNCTDLEKIIVNAAVAKVKAYYMAELMKLRRGATDDCYKLTSNISITVSLYVYYDEDGTPHYQVKTVLDGTIVLLYYDANCVLRHKTIRFNQKTSYYNWIKPGVLQETDGINPLALIGGPLSCRRELRMSWDEPFGPCLRCDNQPTPNPVDEGSFDGIGGGT